MNTEDAAILSAVISVIITILVLSYLHGIKKNTWQLIIITAEQVRLLKVLAGEGKAKPVVEESKVNIAENSEEKSSSIMPSFFGKR